MVGRRRSLSHQLACVFSMRWPHGLNLSSIRHVSDVIDKLHFCFPWCELTVSNCELLAPGSLLRWQCCSRRFGISNRAVILDIDHLPSGRRGRAFRNRTSNGPHNVSSYGWAFGVFQRATIGLTDACARSRYDCRVNHSHLSPAAARLPPHQLVCIGSRLRRTARTTAIIWRVSF
jgi:hypothetical protein